MAMKVKDREVIVTMSHVSVEPDMLDDAIQHPETQRIAAEIRARSAILEASHIPLEHTFHLAQSVCSYDESHVVTYSYADQKIIVGVDVCQRLSGGALKLAAFEKLLTDYSSMAGKVVLLQVNGNILSNIKRHQQQK